MSFTFISAEAEQCDMWNFWGNCSHKVALFSQ